MTEKAKLIIVMGVSGCGKSTVARALAEHFNYQFVEADDFHPEENKQRMANGIALTDAMREPWIALLQTHLKHLVETGHSCVMSFSGLRRRHRSIMRDLPCDVRFLYLKGAKSVIRKRMSSRVGHFMPAYLLESQFADFEKPCRESDITSINIDQKREAVIEDALKTLG